jgi:hypothetical protein
MKWNTGSFRIGAVLVLLACTVATYAAEKFALRVNAGDQQPYKDKAGQVWQAGKEYKKGGGFGFLGGGIVDRGTEMKIAGTENPRIYQTEHYGMDGFKAEVPNGKYTVRLHFAETYEDIGNDGPRVFDVKLQGQLVLKDFDVQKTAGVVQKAVVKEFKGVAVKDGLLALEFIQKQQSPEINGIEILAE